MGTTARIYASRRQAIVNAMADLAKEIDGDGEYYTNLENQTSPRLLYWDEVDQFPAVHFQAGTETRIYQGGGFKERYLEVTARCYVNEEDSVDALDALIEDLEVLFEINAQLDYKDRAGASQKTHDITLVNISTDEGVLDPLGVAEVSFLVRY